MDLIYIPKQSILYLPHIHILVKAHQVFRYDFNNFVL
jgi:hypothetical protein